MQKKESFYFKNDSEWRNWLSENHATSEGIYLIFYKVENEEASMRWEEAVKVALCFGWIDATVKSLGNGKRRQYFCKRNPKSAWSALNKKHIQELKTTDFKVFEKMYVLGTICFVLFVPGVFVKKLSTYSGNTFMEMRIGK